MAIYNDLTNVFGVYGGNGIGPGNHTSKEFLSTKAFDTILNNFNLLSKSCAYQFVSPEGHLSLFYGMIIGKKISGDMAFFLDSSTSNYGINLEKLDATNSVDTGVFNSTTNMFELPLNEDLIFEAYDPSVKFVTLYQDDSLKKYIPKLVSFDYDNGEIVKFQLLSVEDATTITLTEMNTFSDYDIRIGVYGVKTIATEVL